MRNTFNKLFVVVFLLAGLLNVATAVADEAGKIAVIDVQRAVLQTEKAKVKLEELKQQADFKANLESIGELEKEYKAMVESYQKERAVMSAEKREEEERRIIDKQQDMKYVAGKIQQSQKEWGDKVLRELGTDMQTVIEGLIKEQKIGLLLRADSGVIVHAGASFDISDQVTERLNAIK